MAIPHELGPSVSLDHGAPVFTIGEYVLVRIPGRIQVEDYEDNDATIIGTNLPPVSTGAGPQHFGFVRNVVMKEDHLSFEVEVYPVLSFTRTGGALTTYNTMTAAAKAALLPLLLSSQLPTPDAFGEPLNFGNWSTYKDSFLHVHPRRFTMTTKRVFKRMNPPLIVPLATLIRINAYRQYVLSTTSIQNHGDPTHPPQNGGGGDEQGSSNPPHGQTGDGGGQAASGVTSVTSSPTIINDGEGEKDGAGLEQFFVKSSHPVEELEDVDEDAQDADDTLRDDLFMLAYDSPIWMVELRRFLQEEEKEKEQLQKERAARLTRWREDIAVQPT